MLLGKFNQPLVALIALIALLIATLNTNVAANVVSPSNDFSNLNPRLISFRTGGLITGVVGVLMMPWKLLERLQLVHLRLAGGLLGPARADRGSDDRRLLPDPPLAARRWTICTAAMEHTSTTTASTGALWSRWSLGIVVALLGLSCPLRLLYDYAWFVGFGVSARCTWC